MNILVVSAWCPFPADNGSRLRAYNLLKQLAARGHRLTLIALGQDDSDMDVARPGLAPLCAGGIHLFPSRFFRSGTLKAKLGFFSPKPRMLLDTWQPDAAREIARQCHTPVYDVVLALELGIAHYIPADTPVPCVLDQVEVSSFVRALDEARSWRTRLRLGLMVAKFRSHIRSLAPHFRLWTSVSEDERAVILRLIGPASVPPVLVLPNGVDLEENGFQPDAPYGAETLVYNGAVSFYANREAVDYFVREIMPLISGDHPETTLQVTGRTDSLSADDPLRSTAGVALTGYLADIRPTVRAAAACVVPLQKGGGTRLKILEAMALGTPVVATSRGAEGIGAAPGEEILLADTPAEFAQATVRMMTQPQERRRVAARARAFVEARYGWQAIGSDLEEALRRAAPPAPLPAQEPVCL